MCGVVGAVCERNVVPLLLEGLRRLEYRGYDSAGIAVIGSQAIDLRRTLGKVDRLEERIQAEPLNGQTGMAHTRWATHGIPSENNAHPHCSHDEIVLVHNGIIENYLEIKKRLLDLGYEFQSDTDSEVVAHLIYYHWTQKGNVLAAVRATLAELQGAYSLVVGARSEAGHLIGARSGAPLVIGLGIGEHFLASDSYALLPLTHRFVSLEEGDVADISREGYVIYDHNGCVCERQVRKSEERRGQDGKGEYKHFMQKEIHEQSRVLAEALEGRIYQNHLLDKGLSPKFYETLAKVRAVHIVACGTSAHAGLVARYAFEAQGISTHVEVASEYRYRKVCVPENCLFISISQSGETADTLCALRQAKELPYLDYVAICNVAESPLVHESGHVLLTRAGREIGVASTKAFTTQLLVLQLLILYWRQANGKNDAWDQAQIDAILRLPTTVERLLQLNAQIEEEARHYRDVGNCIYLARGELYPIAMEGALKLKELSYIHAEAYPAGELKHGPLALIDSNMPVIALLQEGMLSQKTLSNLQEVQSRGGKLLVFHDERLSLAELPQARCISLGAIEAPQSAIAFVLPLQLFAYHVALQKGTDVDQPRNLAKAVTVE